MVVVTTREAPRSFDVRLVLCLVAVYVIWSSTYLAIHIAVAELPPLLVSSMRFVAAGLVMMLVALRRGVAFPRLGQWLRTAPIGVCYFLGGNGFLAMAQHGGVSSGGAAVVAATMPLWVAAFSMFSRERPSGRDWFALLLGFGGVVVLMGGPSLGGSAVAIVLVCASPLCWATGAVLARRLPGKQDPFMFPAMQMLAGGAVLAVVAALDGERIPTNASAGAWAAVVYLFAMGSLVGFTAYNWLLRNARPVVATSYAYVNPILAVLLGAVLSGEPLGPTTVVANVMIVGAVMLALRKPAK